MWSGRCHLMSPAPLVIRWHHDIGDLSPPAIITDQAVNSCQEKQTESRVHKQVPSPSGLIWPDQCDQAPSSHISRSERDLSLGWYWASLAAWSLVISVIIRCYGVCRVSDHTLTPPEPHISGVYCRVVSLNVYSMLIAFVLKLRLENCIQIQFASNLHQIMDLLGWFLATIEFQIWLCLILRYHYHFQTHQIEIPSTNWPAL